MIETGNMVIKYLTHNVCYTLYYILYVYASICPINEMETIEITQIHKREKERAEMKNKRKIHEDDAKKQLKAKIINSSSILSN